MSKTKLSKEKPKDIYLFSTSVENIFINELLPISPGDYVKVYLFCLMYAEQEKPVSVEMVSKTLRMSVEQVDEAWEYWERWGAVKRIASRGSDDYEVVFLSEIDNFYGTKSNKGMNAVPGDRDDRSPAEQYPDEVSALINRELKALNDQFEQVAGRTISRQESEKIADAIGTYGITPDVFSYAIGYCAEIEKRNIDYIYKVALRWKQEGCKNISDVKAYLDSRSKRESYYKSVFREMGWSRLSSPGDREIMDRWFDDWGFELDEVLAACRMTAGMREPSLKYVNKVLENKYLEAGGIDPKTVVAREAESKTTARVSRRVLEDYYSHLQEEADRRYRARISEISESLPQIGRIISIESEINRSMLSFDFSSDAKTKRSENRDRLKQLEEEKKRILAENGYPEDYLEKKYKCGICRDTGITDEGRYCTCNKDRAEEAYIWNKSKNKAD